MFISLFIIRHKKTTKCFNYNTVCRVSMMVIASKKGQSNNVAHTPHTQKTAVSQGFGKLS